MFNSIFENYNLLENEVNINLIHHGLINNTWLIECKDTDDKYILQCINHNIFKNPYEIDENIKLIANYLLKEYPTYIFPKLISTTNNRTMITNDHLYYRLYEYIPNTITYLNVDNSQIAYEASKQFGKFTANLNNFLFNNSLNIIISDFHNLKLKYDKYNEVIHDINLPTRYRLENLQDLLIKVNEYTYIVDIYINEIVNNKNFSIRVTHHDTKISNVLFDENQKGICVIDLDTVMPGYFISDIGDMFRTYICPVNEEENDFTKINIILSHCQAICQGYLSEMKLLLSPTELLYLTYSGKFSMYMQLLRFLTDYIEGDIYYKVNYPEHNLNRAYNQLYLLEKYCLVESELNSYIKTL